MRNHYPTASAHAQSTKPMDLASFKKSCEFNLYRMDFLIGIPLSGSNIGFFYDQFSELPLFLRTSQKNIERNKRCVRGLDVL